MKTSLSLPQLLRHALIIMASVLCVPGIAQADPLSGTLTDGLTGYPVEGSVVRIAGTSLSTMTDAEGRWAFDVPRGVYQVDFAPTFSGGHDDLHVSLVNQHVPQYKSARARVYTTWFIDQGVPQLGTPMGIPTTSGALPAGSPESLKLPISEVNPLALAVTDPIPRRIRVGRRQRPEEGCSNNPVIAIEEMDIDDYVKGVLPPEIGVFRGIPGAAETYKAFGIAAKSYGLWFMLTYDESNRRNVDAPLPPDNHTWFHIDDTACNQRYSDDRLTITTAAAEAIANKILVKKGEPGVLDKLEYAASCGQHGTLPEYGTTSALVPDMPPVNACAGSWCGHNTCAGHEDNPNLAGTDRCLVRGMCQWGTASWGESGKDYLWILAHYQPNLEIRELRDMEPATSVELRGYVYTDAADIPGSAVSGMDVTLSSGPRTTTDAQGIFSFPGVDVTLANVTLMASGTGYETVTQDKQLVAGEVNWASLLIRREGSVEPDMGAMTRDMDAGTRDLGSGAMKDMSAGADQGTPGPQQEEEGFDSLITTSTGVEGGCAQVRNHRRSLPTPTPGGVLWCGVLGGLLAWRGSRRR